MKRTLVLTAVVAMLFCLAGAASAKTYKVTDLPTLARIVGETAEPGDVIELQPGTYYPEVDRISILRSGTPDQSIVIRGVIENGKRPVLDVSRVNVRRCVFGFGTGVHDIAFENLDICNAVGSRFPDRRKFGVNACVIYFESCHNVTMRNSKARPRKAQFATLVAVRGIGRREALAKLEVLKAKEQRGARRVRKLARRKPR